MASRMAVWCHVFVSVLLLQYSFCMDTEHQEKYTESETEVKSNFRVLLLPAGQTSHVHEQFVVGKELVSRGHQVYLALPTSCPQLDRFTVEGIEVLTYRAKDNLTSLMSESYEERLSTKLFEGQYSIFSEITKVTFRIIRSECEDLMDDDQFLERVKSLNLDLVMVDGIPIDPCRSILPVYLDVPFVVMGSILFPWFARIPTMPSVTPPVFLDASHDMSFLMRSLSLLMNIAFYNELAFNAADTTLLKKYFPEYSAWGQLTMKAALFINLMDYHLEWPAPTMPNTRFLPGITISPANPLPLQLRSKVDASTQGIILFSFGSTGGYMPGNTTSIFFDAFAQLEQTVYMRLSSIPSGTVIPANVHVTKWMPQNDLLAHPNTKLFITHCGNNGQYEALYHGVPMLGIPLFAEQAHNAFRIQDHGFGLSLDILTLTAAELRDTIKEIMYNNTYRENIRKKSAILHDRQMLPPEEAAYWMEHVMRHGGDHLRSSASDMSLMKFFMVDIFLVATVVLVALTWLVYMLLKCIVGRVFGVMRKPKEKTL